MTRRRRRADTCGDVCAALYSPDSRASELLLAHCAALEAGEPEPEQRKSVRERLGESLGADLLRFLLFGLGQRARSPRRSA
jgi:hypothetical protein